MALQLRPILRQRELRLTSIAYYILLQSYRISSQPMARGVKEERVGLYLALRDARNVT